MLFRRITHYYIHDMKLSQKLTLSHLLIGLLPSLALTIFVFAHLSSAVITNTLRSEGTLVNQTADSLSSVITQIARISDNLVSDPALASLLYSEPADLNGSPDYLQTLGSYIDTELVTDIQIYLPQKYHCLWENELWKEYFQPEERTSGSYWHGIFEGTGKTALFCPAFYLSSRELEEHGSLAYIRPLPGVEPEGYLAVYFSENYLKNILTSIMNNSSTNTAVSFIINERNSLVSTSSKTLYGTHVLAYEDVPSIIGSTSEFAERLILGEHVYMGYRRISGCNWYLISVIPTASVFGERNLILATYLLIFLLLFIAVYCLSMWLAKSIVHRIYALIGHMSTLRSGEPVLMEAAVDCDEIGKLVESYNYMTQEIHRHTRREREISKELQLSEFRALQAQINPHFLYNMLDMINWLAKSNDSDKVCRSVTALSQFYKLTLNRGQPEVKIEDELRHVSLYVELQNMRYDDSIQFIVDVPDEILDYKIPNLVLQPIVENSIIHGIFEKESKSGTIVIMAWIEGDYILFTISDDGAGIPKEAMETLLSGAPGSGSGSNVGIYNTHRRLQLYYHSEYGLSYQSEQGKGTEVTLRIPLKPDDI